MNIGQQISLGIIADFVCFCEVFDARKPPQVTGEAARPPINLLRFQCLMPSDVWTGFWWARQDLNLGPTDYESAALTAELQARRVCNCLILYYLCEMGERFRMPQNGAL
jgi:hypothetical protein